MEFILSTDLATAIPQEISFNYDELKTQLAESLDRYNNLVVTEDAIQPAKKDRAALNALYKAIEDKRKSVKKACLAPYETFETKAKELTGMIQQPIDAIDRQVKGFEEQKRQEKYKAIEHFYNDNIKELRDLVPLEKIIPDKWANAGIALISVTQDIMGAINKARNELGIIQKMGLPFESQIVDVYLRTLDMGAALAEKNRLEEQEKALAQAKRQREAERAAAIDAEPVIIDGNTNMGDIPNGTPVRFAGYAESASDIAPPEEPKTIKVIFYDTTAAFRQDMKALTEKYGVKYGGIQ